jgi:metal-responsive CopG/Arc/MetJ family transcriptional regulator
MPRSQLTISLDSEEVAGLDRMVEEAGIWSREQAIAAVVREWLAAGGYLADDGVEHDLPAGMKFSVH